MRNDGILHAAAPGLGGASSSAKDKVYEFDLPLGPRRKSPVRRLIAWDLTSFGGPVRDWYGVTGATVRSWTLQRCGRPI